MRVHRCLVQEKILHDYAFHIFKRMSYMLRIWVRLYNVLTYTVQSLETTLACLIQHIRDTQPRLAA